MPGVTISCPRCKSNLKSGRPIPAGQTIRCPKCGTAFEAPSQENQPDSSVQANPPNPVRERKTERAVSESRPARDDQEAVVVRKKTPSRIQVDEVEEGVLSDEAEEEFDEPRRRRRRKKRKQGHSKALFIIIGSAAIVLLFAGGVAYFVWSALYNRGQNKGTGKEDPLAYVPADSTQVVGLDFSALMDQPALAAKIEQALRQSGNDNPVDNCRKNTGLEFKDLCGHIVIASKVTSFQPNQFPQTTVIIQSKMPFDQNKVRDWVSDQEPRKHQGKTYYQAKGTQARDFPWVFMPSDRILIFSGLLEDQVKSIVENDGSQPALPGDIVTAIRGMENNTLWMTFTFSENVRQKLAEALPQARGQVPAEMAPVVDALPEAKLIALSANWKNDQISANASMVCAQDDVARQVAEAMQNAWDKLIKNQADWPFLAMVPKDGQSVIQELIDNTKFSSQGSAAQLVTQFRVSADQLAKLIQPRMFAPAGMPAQGQPGMPAMRRGFQPPGGGAGKKRGGGE
jgi:hypothetical protein